MSFMNVRNMIASTCCMICTGVAASDATIERSLRSTVYQAITIPAGASIQEAVSDVINGCGTARLVSSIKYRSVKGTKGASDLLLPQLSGECVSAWDMLMAICDEHGYMFSIEEGALIVCPNQRQFYQCRNWRDRNGKSFSGRWIGTLDNGSALILECEGDGVLLSYPPSSLSASDRQFVSTSIERYFKPVYKSIVDSRKGDKQEPDIDSNGQRANSRVFTGSGSGFFVTSNGYLVTNDHVIRNARRIEVVCEKGVYEAACIMRDEVADLALLKVTGIFVPIVFDGLDEQRLGCDIFTMGFPRPSIQGYSPKVTRGVISGLEGGAGNNERYQIDAAVQPGNSGGPVANRCGHLVGVVVSVLKNDHSDAPPQNVNFAIKKSTLLRFLQNEPQCFRYVRQEPSNGDGLFEDAVSKVQRSCAMVRIHK